MNRKHRSIAVMGYPGVGKSSITNQFVYEHFSDQYDPTIRSSVKHTCEVNRQVYELSVVDHQGTDHYSVHHGDLENSDAYILVYSIDDEDSFKQAGKIRERIQLTSAMERIPIVLVGNKIDRRDDRVISKERGLQLAKEWKVPFIEASARDLNVVRQIFTTAILAMDDDYDPSPAPNGNGETVDGGPTPTVSGPHGGSTSPMANGTVQHQQPQQQQQASNGPPIVTQPAVRGSQRASGSGSKQKSNHQSNCVLS